MDESITFTRRIIPATDTSFGVFGNPLALLIHADGPDGSTVFVDSSGTHTLVANPTVIISTARFMFGGSSLRNDGVVGSLDLGPGETLPFRGGDFTVDFWFNLSAAGIGTTQGFYTSASVGTIFQISYNGTTIEIPGKCASAVVIVGDTWYHCAAAKQAGTLYFFLNGFLQSTFNDSANAYITNQFTSIGVDAAFNQINGWMDEIRVLVGHAAWTSNFGPPSSPYYPP